VRWIISFFLLCINVGHCASVWYVATNGNDSWTGTLASPNGGLTDGPFLTVEKARATVQAAIVPYVSFNPTNEPGGSGTNIISWWLASDYITNAGTAILPDRGGVNNYDLTNSAATSTWPVGDGTNITWDGVNDYLMSGGYQAGSTQEIVMIFSSQTDTNATGVLFFWATTNASSAGDYFYQSADTTWKVSNFGAGTSFMYPLTNVFIELDILCMGNNSVVYTNNIQSHLLFINTNAQNGLIVGEKWDKTSATAMQLKEMMTYSAPLSSASRNNLASYFAMAKGTPAPTNGFTVYIENGTYFSDTALSLTSVDSGSVAYPIQYKAYPGHSPRLIAGRRLSTWAAITNATVLAKLTASAQTNALEADISTFPTLLPYARYGYGITWNGQNELFFNQTPMQVARFPNTGWLSLGTITGTSFICTNAQPYTWTDTNIFALGYWAHDYAETAEFVTNFNSGAQTVSLTQFGPFGGIAGHRYYFLNILNELDSAGEYYIDHDNLKVYFWPTTSIASGETFLSTSSNVLQIVNVNYVNFSGITFEGGTMNIVAVGGGSNIKFDHCTFRNTSGLGLYILNSFGSGLDHCTITGTGRGIAWLNGGDKPSLTSNSNYITSCTAHDYARDVRVYECVQLSGVGHLCSHNKIYNGPHNAIRFDGNNHLIEYNLIYNVCTETGDAGAIYAGQNWSWAGNVVRFNYLHDILRAADVTDFRNVGVYFDDGLSGNYIYGNAFNRVEQGILLGGGRNTVISNNLFASSQWFGILSDQRIVVQPALLTTLSNSLIAMPYNTSPWSNQYPFMLTYLTDHPTNNWNNTITTCTATNSHFGDTDWIAFAADGSSTNQTVINGYTNGNALYIDFVGDNLRVSLSSPLYSLSPAWTAIPFDEIGPIPEPTPGTIAQNLKLINGVLQ